MSLLPYKVTALARVDNGDLNIIPNASVTVLTSSGMYAQLYEADGTTPIGNPFNCDDNGERQIYLSGGIYSISVEGGQSWEIRLSGASDIQSVATIADLRSYLGSGDSSQVLLGGIDSPGIGGGAFYRVTNAALTDDGRDVIRYGATDIYWIRQDLSKYQIEDVAEHNGLVFNERDDTQLASVLRRNYKYKIDLPPEFSSTFYLLSDINIYFKGGRYWSDFDVRNFRPVRAAVRYVNPTLGSDDNDGLSWATSYATVKKALEIAATVDLEIRVAPGVYYFSDGPQGFNPARGVSIICDQGIAEFRNQATPRLWTESTTYPGLYTTPNLQYGEDWTGQEVNLRFFLQSTGTTTAGGGRLPSMPVGDLQAGSVGAAVGTASTAVRLPNDINPNFAGYFHVNWVSNNIRVICPPGEDHVIYTENIKAIFGSNHTAYFETATEGSQCIHVNCEFSDGHAENSATWLVGGLVVNIDCQAHRGFKDGFNYHVNGASSGRTSVLEINCKAHFNGRDAAGTNNGSTAHESVRIIRIAGDYSCNQNRNVHDINGSKSFNVGCKAKRAMDNNSASFAFGRSGQGDPTIGWMVGCETDVIDVYAGAQLSISDDTTYRDLQIESGGQVFDFNP